MDREPTLWERQLQKQTATGVEAALASLEKRPVVATCTTPPAPASSSRPSPRRARGRWPSSSSAPTRFAPRASSRAARSPGRAAGAGRAEAVADDGFAEIARAAPDDEAVALALREALPRKPASAPAAASSSPTPPGSGRALGAAAAAYDGAALRAAPAAFAADALADDAASACATLLSVQRGPGGPRDLRRRAAAKPAGSGSTRPPRRWRSPRRSARGRRRDGRLPAAVPRAVVACAPRGGLEAYESLAAPAFDGGEAVACHVLGDEPRVLKRHAEDLDDAAPAASPADERTCVAERLRALARRAQRPFLRRGRVGRVDRAGNGRDIPNCKGS
ncbi:hypothetical protein JL722_9547 [Aureococcus anophagefferens]|nr:hypothetical protein JL722_9547 [Aureococcus anophagefferens]